MREPLMASAIMAIDRWRHSLTEVYDATIRSIAASSPASSLEVRCPIPARPRSPSRPVGRDAALGRAGRVGPLLKRPNGRLVFRYIPFYDETTVANQPDAPSYSLTKHWIRIRVSFMNWGPLRLNAPPRRAELERVPSYRWAMNTVETKHLQ